MNRIDKAKGIVSSLLFSLVLVPVLADNPSYDHVVVVMLENHSYQEVAGDSSLTFINDTLRPGGADMLSYGVEHPSQPNYYWLFSGSNQGITNDSAPTAPFTSAPNLYTSVTNAGKSFTGFVDAYPGAGNLYSDTNNYVTRHVPWLGFSNVPTNVTQNFTSFPTSPRGFASLPTVSVVIPGLDHDMHDYNSNGDAVGNVSQSQTAMQNSDAWLQQNLAAYAAWAKDNNSLLIVTTDEDSSADWPNPIPGSPGNTEQNTDGYTSPTLGPNNSPNTPPAPTPPLVDSGPNQITTIFYGANVIPGFYDESGNGITNINVLETILSFYGQDPLGDQPSLITADTNITASPITDIFGAVPEPAASGWMTAGALLLVFVTRKLSRNYAAARSEN